jgi:hypothetical protein
LHIYEQRIPEFQPQAILESKVVFARLSPLVNFISSNCKTKACPELKLQDSLAHIYEQIVSATGNAGVKSCVCLPVLPFCWLILLVQTVRPGSQSQLLLQGLPGAETSIRGSSDGLVSGGNPHIW